MEYKLCDAEPFKLSSVFGCLDHRENIAYIRYYPKRRIQSDSIFGTIVSRSKMLLVEV